MREAGGKRGVVVRVEGHRLPAGVRHVRTVEVCHVRVPVVLATYALVPELREADGTLLDGWFDHERGIVFVRDGQSKSLERDATNHEIVHALLYYSGVQDFFAGIVKGKAVEHEETMVRILAPHMARVRWVK